VDKTYVEFIDPARRPIAMFSSTINALLALSTGADAADMLSAWKQAGDDVSSERWHFAIAHSGRQLPIISAASALSR
jgi:hypothetical protein